MNLILDPDQPTCDMTRYVLESLLPYKCRYCTREFDRFTRYLEHRRAHENKYRRFWWNRGKALTKYGTSKKVPLLNGKRGTLESTYTSKEDNLKYTCYGDIDGGIVVKQYRDKKFIKLFTYRVFEDLPVAGRNLPCQYMFPGYKRKSMSVTVINRSKHRRKGCAQKLANRTGGGKYICRTCSKSFNNAYTWELHENSHSVRTTGSKVSVALNTNKLSKKLLCKICSKVFHQADILELHERSHAFKTPEKMNSTSGSPCVSNRRFILDAVGDILQENGSYNCKHCTQSFSELAEWELHERSHTFRNSTQKILTLKIREAVQAFAETAMAKEESQEIMLESSAKEETVTEPEIREIAVDSEIQEIPAESMPTDHVFKRLPINVRSLIKSRVPIVTNRSPGQGKLFQRKFPEEHVRLQKVTKQLQEQLKKHSTADPPQLAEIQLKKIPRRGPAVSVSPRGQLLPCRFCSMKFETVNELALHDKTHRNKPPSKRPFQCGLCGKFFTQSGSLRAHERIHTGERPYSCSICEKSFHESGKLRRHQRTHTGEKPYECRWCLRRFAQNGTRKSHEKTHKDMYVTSGAPPGINLVDVSHPWP